MLCTTVAALCCYYRQGIDWIFSHVLNESYNKFFIIVLRVKYFLSEASSVCRFFRSKVKLTLSRPVWSDFAARKS